MRSLPTWKPLRKMVKQDQRFGLTRWLFISLVLGISSKIIFSQFAEFYILDLVNEKRLSLFCELKICTSPFDTSPAQLVHFKDSLHEDFLYASRVKDGSSFKLDSNEHHYTIEANRSYTSFFERQFDSTQVTWIMYGSNHFIPPELISLEFLSFYRNLNDKERLHQKNLDRASVWLKDQHGPLAFIKMKLQIPKSSGLTPKHFIDLSRHAISLESADKLSQDFYLIEKIKSREVFGLTLR